MKIGHKVRVNIPNTLYNDREGIVFSVSKGVRNHYSVELSDCALSLIEEQYLEHIPSFNIGDTVVLKDIEAVHQDSRGCKATVQEVYGKNQYWQNDEFEYAVNIIPKGQPSYCIRTEETHMELCTKSTPVIEYKCTCDILALMTAGCKCGQIERERESAKHVPA